ncbi:uncharacterized protein LOC105431021 isoform X2 [Pogonomyrmex barbatus]|uniref:Uncharacterized protein LOC105431021 isoform X2 n=1 Tax=Pogonomyrmex barbatus TaxID=144034 RepID=A0A6I9WN88_9HYME|nr:uncharacterized protein LOC105431021 isoform X2 [Pogonomyrmex barbatus]
MICFYCLIIETKESREPYFLETEIPTTPLNSFSIVLKDRSISAGSVGGNTLFWAGPKWSSRFDHTLSSQTNVVLDIYVFTSRFSGERRVFRK